MARISLVRTYRIRFLQSNKRLIGLCITSFDPSLCAVLVCFFFFSFTGTVINNWRDNLEGNSSTFHWWIKWTLRESAFPQGSWSVSHGTNIGRYAHLLLPSSLIVLFLRNRECIFVPGFSSEPSVSNKTVNRTKKNTGSGPTAQGSPWILGLLHRLCQLKGM